MGEAKRRGSFEERKTQAIKEGRNLAKVRLLRHNARARARARTVKYNALMAQFILSGMGKG